MTSTDGTRTSVYRFDRRPSVGTISVLSSTALRGGDSGPAKDEYMVDVESSNFSRAQCEVEIIFRGRADLSSIIKACFGIAQDPQARNYSLQKYNCFFFSWTILMVVSREHLPYRVPTYDIVEPRCHARIPDLTATIVNQAVDLLQGIVLEMTSKFRSMNNKELKSGMSPFERLVWKLPTKFLQTIWKRLFRLQLYLGMREKLEKHIEEAINQRVKGVWSAVLSSRLTPDLLDANLWLRDMKEVVEPAMIAELYSVLWDGILSAIAGGQETQELMSGDSSIELPFSLVGKRAAQLGLVWKSVLPSMLIAARDAAIGKSSGGREENARMFDLAWSSGAEAALKTAQSVVARTRSQFKHKDRHDRLWSAVWEMWDGCLSATQDIARQRALEVIDQVVQNVVGTGVATFMEAMQSTELEKVEARVFDKAESTYQNIELTGLSLGHRMQEIIHKDVVGQDALDEVKRTMGAIWEGVRFGRGQTEKKSR
ncbi:hypothetical protein RhiJN_25185 [Ceratobasidium sp. AG-Ba]|nr:hypothetical protein RhiJN_25185 [Ceratobasidium sp. AG-Ba]